MRRESILDRSTQGLQRFDLRPLVDFLLSEPLTPRLYMAYTALMFEIRLVDQKLDRQRLLMGIVEAAHYACQLRTQQVHNQVYLNLALDCDFPILEAIAHSMRHRLERLPARIHNGLQQFDWIWRCYGSQTFVENYLYNTGIGRSGPFSIESIFDAVQWQAYFRPRSP
jgi:hypothetical protein